MYLKFRWIAYSLANIWYRYLRQRKQAHTTHIRKPQRMHILCGCVLYCAHDRETQIHYGGGQPGASVPGSIADLRRDELSQGSSRGMVGLAALLGHSILETMRIYVQPSAEDLGQLIKQTWLNVYS
jgi:hypothetical protein